MTRNTRIGFIVAAVVVVVVAIVVIGTGGSGKRKLTTGTTQIQVKDGKPVGGVKKIEVKQGTRVTYTVSVDKASDVHTHGYDIHMDATPSKPATFSFVAKDTGVFEIEVEPETQVASLRVDP